MEEHDMDDGMTASERLVWSVEEAGRLLGISRAYAYELVARGELPHVRLGRRLVVPKHAIQALLAATDDADDSLNS
jgi:excisionase family DNA binding protein